MLISDVDAEEGVRPLCLQRAHGAQAPGQLRNRLRRIWLIELRHCTAEPGKKCSRHRTNCFLSASQVLTEKLSRPPKERSTEPHQARSVASGCSQPAGRLSAQSGNFTVSSGAPGPAGFCAPCLVPANEQLAEPHTSNRSLTGQRRGDSGQS